MDISEIRELSHLVRCGFIDKLKTPELVCPGLVELIHKYSVKYKNKHISFENVKHDKNIRLSSLHILVTYSKIFSLQTIQLLSNQYFLNSIISVIQILLSEDHEVITSETEQILNLILFHTVEKEQSMLCRVAIKNGLLDLLIQIIMMPNSSCITIKLKNVILRTIVAMVRFSPNAASKTWLFIKNELDKFLFSDQISMRLWSIKYISHVIKMLEASSENNITLDFVQPLNMFPNIFVLMYDECLPIKLQTIKTVCRIIISPNSKRECKQLVYMGIIGLLVDILDQHEFENCTNSIVIPIVVSLIRIVKLSEKWCMVFIYSNGIKKILHYLKYPIDSMIISVFLLVYNASIYSSFHTNRILEDKALDKLHRVKDLVDSKNITNLINKIIFSLVIRCTDYDTLNEFIFNCGEHDIIENELVQAHFKKIYLINQKLNKILKLK